MADSTVLPPAPPLPTGPPALARARSELAWRAVAAALIIALLAVAGMLLAEILDDNATLDEMRWFGHIASLLTIIAVAIGVALIRRAAIRQALRPSVSLDPNVQPAGTEPSSGTVFVPGILIGADNRLSTSKLAALVWTCAIAWAIVSLAIADWVGAAAGWNALVDQGLQDEYLILLGGPFLALVGAKGLVTASVESGTVTKTPATGEQTAATRVSQAFSDDNGQADLVDSQYLIFGAVAVLVFVVALLRDAGAGLPDLPDFLVGLTGVGATVYIANKAVARDAPPHLDRVVPDRARPGDVVTIFGRNLLTVSQAGRRAAASDRVRVFLGAHAAVEVDPQGVDAHTTPSGHDHFTFTVPAREAFNLPAGDHAVAVIVQNAIGVTSDNAVPFVLVLN